ncbi:kinesin motor catalytic domain protein (macronuclear) [Tetrahymena thermophila SB210]|uniref:Kinesin-like protein n=1 Tax=Tetrahymena thermophila (strain SB210) TaxID=312017 RepID=Q229Q4_TETTS|nr:kinesin motor catalytic domain protein [Tetrahymena thermophila SB210]EAR82018.2 kinesin motor catalytic domain protein [Tetrahymena thermophila SB210]|eukprot:XP_001029681.2 kinesin motor catalytic domain protein [Tetrahymena thermophila SB210]
MNNKDYLNDFNLQRNNYIDQLKNGQNNILVAIRCRPLNQREIEKSEYEVVRILDERVVVLIDPYYESNQNDVLRKNRNKEMQFAFDYAFDETISQVEIYEKTSNFLLDGVIEGFNATVFAYGATGAGKTYTMVGSPDNPGIMSRTMNQLYYLIQQNSNQNHFVVRVSYLEIYNENIKDLLSIEDKNLDLREDPSQGVVVAGITEIECSSTQEIMALLKVGNRNRTKEATEANEASSRSHAVLQVQVEIKQLEQGPQEEVKYSKLSMVDLAGSERAANTSNRGLRMIEGAKINQSLLCLGNCIQALSQIQEKKNSNLFVPYRGSKLTRLLKDSLGGNCRTVMIANVSPSVLTFEDTYNTLNYANRAKNIKTNVVRNILNVENHLNNYAQIIQNLRQENEQLKRQLSDKQGINLPPINQGSDYEQIQNESLNKLEKIIQKHFQLELDIQKSQQDVDFQIDKINGLIFQSLQDPSNDKDIVKDKIDSFKQNLKSLMQQKEDYTNKYINLIDKRNDLLTQIKQANLSLSNNNYIMSVYKQAQVQTESIEIQYREKKSDNQSKHKEQQVQFLQQQIKLRDGVINDWKNIIQEGKLKNKIIYKNLKNVEDVADFARLNHSTITNQSIIQNGSPVNTSLQHSPKRRVQSQISVHPKMYPNQQQKISQYHLPTRKNQLSLQQGSDTNLPDSYSAHSKSSKGNRQNQNYSPANFQPNYNLLKARQQQLYLQRNQKFLKQQEKKYFN